tara:strand:+ start:568 stop:1023 length:456 start_codon:yes stop_codon:yes gene_type:complete
MNYIFIKNLEDSERLIIEAIRIWIKSMVYDQNPLPTLTTLFNNYSISKTVIPFDDLMGCIALSSNKKYDFRKVNCNFVGESEKNILLVLYYLQFSKATVTNYYLSNLVNQKFKRCAFECSKLICKNFITAGLFFENPFKYLEYNNRKVILF